MNILLVYKEADIATYKMLEGLSKLEDFNIYIASPQSYTDKKIYGNCTPLDLPVITSKFNWNVIRALRKIIKTYRIDLIYSPSSSGLSNALFASIGTRAKNIAYRGTQAKLKRFDPTYYLGILNPAVEHVVCETKDIEEYLSYLKYYEKNGVEHTNDERGIKRKLASLRSFYRYYFKNDLIKNDPAVKVDMPKIHDKNIIRLDIDEVARLLDEVESGESLTPRQQKYHDRTKTRDLALMTLLLGTGIRVSECVGLDLEDVDMRNNGIKIHRKGGAEVVVYFGEEVREALLAYMVERQKITAEDGSINALFLSLQNRRISVRSVENLVKKYAKLVTSLKHITPHKLRSTYGTSLYRETGDIYLVADVLGHKDVNTTRKHYAAIDDDRRRSAAKYVKLRDV